LNNTRSTARAKAATPSQNVVGDKSPVEVLHG
jgi:hypothetical protein